MIYSMTGFGKATFTIKQKKYNVEIRALNSKSLDLNVKIPAFLRNKELDIRNRIAEKVIRGKIDLYIAPDNEMPQCAEYTPININTLDYYVSTLQEYAKQKNMNVDVLSIAMRLPEVLKPIEQEEASNEEYTEIIDSIESAICQLNDFRAQEGLSLQNMLSQKVQDISSLLLQVEPFEKDRITKIRQRMENNLNLLSAEINQAIDKNRLEQEMIFYLEKLDINEEKVRLRNHIKYFEETLNNNELAVGKKLGFIAQEMGREINTLGSKSNHSEMQIIVVKMKDCLEQIKEQILNVL